MNFNCIFVQNLLEPMSIKKILVIRFRRVGDATLSLALCSSLHKSFPESEVHFVVNDNIAPLFEHHPAIQKLITFNHKELKNTLEYIKKVRDLVKNETYDIIIDERSTLKTLLFSLYSWRKTKYRIGRTKKYNYLIHNYRVNNNFDGIRDNVQLNLELLKPLKKQFNIVEDRNFKIYVTEEEKIQFRKYMAAKGINFSKPIVLCTVATRDKNKCWDHNKMQETLSRILTKYPETQLIFNYSGEDEYHIAKSLYEKMGANPKVFIDIEAKNLRELSALLCNVNFFFGNEGGTRHIAQALDIPAFAIYIPNQTKTQWLPNPSEKHQGIDLSDINLEASKDANLTLKEKQALLDIESIWIRLDNMLEKWI